MKTLRFKTDLKCEECVESVRPEIEKIPDIREWSIDLDSPDSILAVRAIEPDPGKVVRALQRAGYVAQIVVDS